jgi:hypothetical protein
MLPAFLGVCGFDQGFEHVESDRLDAIVTMVNVRILAGGDV